MDNVLGYASSLENAIARDDLVAMRRHERPDGYLESFASCVQRRQAAPPEEVQLNLFSLSADGDSGEDMDGEYGGISMT